VTRNGVLDELAEARDVGAKLEDPGFIIPIRADDLSWSDFPIQLKQLNGVDFSEDWAFGFKVLLDSLDDASVPRDVGDPDVAKIARALVTAREQVLPTPEQGLVNWLAIRKLPRDVHYYSTSMSASALAASRARISVPCVSHDRLLLSFAELDAVRRETPGDMQVEPRYTIALKTFLEGNAKKGPSVDERQAHNYLANIVRQSFDNCLRARGLVQYDRRWFVPNNWREKNQGHYIGPTGKRQSRVLVGKAKESVWHFALAVTVRAQEPRRANIMPHVLFSPDGTIPYPDQKQLRRRHCKLWWNDKWRDLLRAFLAEIFGHELGVVDISMGGEARMQIDRTLLELQLPVSYSEEKAHVPLDDEEGAIEWDSEDDEALLQ
jgi:hypothetical protein